MNTLKRALFFSVLLTLAGINTVYSQVPSINPIQGATVICSPVATAFNYSVSAGNAPTSYSWTYAGPNTSVVISNPSASITAVSFPSPYVNASYTLYCYATNGSGSSTTVSCVVSVFEKPTITFSGAHVICQGSSTNISASSTIFQASSTTISYNWSPPTGLSSTTSSMVIANPPASTNYTLLIANGPCTNTNYFNVIVNPTPTVAALFSQSTICSGKNSILVTGGSASSYSLNSVYIPFTASVSPSVTTSYTVTGSDANGCSGLPVVLTLSVIPTPSLSALLSPPAICRGDTSTLLLSGSAVISYSVNGNTSSASLSLFPVLSSTYTVVGTAANGCQSVPQQLILPVNSLPNISVSSVNTVICNGESAVLLFSGTSSSYSLNGNSSASTATVTPSAPTIYTVTGKDANGCENFVTYALIVAPCMGIEDIKNNASSFEIFPNPANGPFVIRSKKSEMAYILNELGQTVKTISLLAGSDTEISGLSSGVYFVIAGDLRKKLVVTP